MNIISTKNITLIFCENVQHLVIGRLNFIFKVDFDITSFRPVNELDAQALKLFSIHNSYIFNSTFQGIAQMTIILLDSSQADINSCTFQKNRNYAPLYIGWTSNIRIYGCLFSENEGLGDGGALSVVYGTAILQGNYFSHNLDYRYGGAIKCIHCMLEIRNNNTFFNNSVIYHPNAPEIIGGGAVYGDGAKVVMVGTVIFTDNFANSGGAMYLRNSQLELIDQGNFVFERNRGHSGDGGGIYANKSAISISSQNVNFTNNSVEDPYFGGAIYINNKDDLGHRTQNLYISGHFTQNRAGKGGAIYAEKVQKISIGSTMFFSNKYTAVVIKESIMLCEKSEFNQNLEGALEGEFTTLYFMERQCF